MYQEQWAQWIPEVERCLNTTTNRPTGRTPYEITRTHRIRDAEDFISGRQRTRDDVKDALDLAQVRIAIRLDSRHKPPGSRGKVWLRVVRPGRHGYQLTGNPKTGPIRTEPFKFKRKVGDLAHKLDLPGSVKIHPVISDVHLEQSCEDEHGRKRPPPAPIVIDGPEKFIIERLFKAKGDQVMVKWKGHDKPTWEIYQGTTPRPPRKGREVLRHAEREKRGLAGLRIVI
ncbi:uncharacterized protein PV07_12582 [Cladophialophora immunda]|uniref:Chromo domain-containing protein n=1 Tax=Cladophialophora immunda TaxID=569365 RepID=A0A0D2BUF5_9EURO|nr:uncharacterized protein PV07_12582 [Cladophialophora immunda]KIW22015.1 hypothetical protein PV07_12582 [Cladophialophora immunda]